MLDQDLSVSETSDDVGEIRTQRERRLPTATEVRAGTTGPGLPDFADLRKVEASWRGYQFVELAYREDIGGPFPVKPTEEMFNHVMKPAKRRPVEELPGKWSDSPAFVRFLVQLRKELFGSLPVDTWKGSGYASSGVATGWWDIGCLIGVAGLPLGTPTPSARGNRLANLSASDVEAHRLFAKNPVLTASEIDIARMLFAELHGRSDDCPSVPFALESVVGAWSHQQAIEGAGADLLTSLVVSPDFFWELVAGNKVDTLCSYGYVLVFTDGYRFQLNGLVGATEADLSPKSRLVYSYADQWVEVDFYVDPAQPGILIFCCRPRVVNIGTMAMAPLRLVGRSGESYLKSIAGDVTLVESAAELNKFCEGAVSIEMYDVKGQEFSCPSEFEAIQLEMLGRDWQPHVINLLRLALHCPTLVRNDDYRIPGRIAKFRGRPDRIEDFVQDRGNPSGIPTTSLFSKIWGIIYSTMALIARKSIQPTLADFRLLLRGKHPNVRLKAFGDNVMVANLVRPEKTLREALRWAVLDEATSYLGWVPLHSGTGNPTWVPNPESAVKKFILADHSINSTKRPFWAYGWYVRKEFYLQNPAAVEALNVLNFTARKMFGKTIDQMANEQYVTPEMSFSDADRQFLLNPDYIHYRLDVEKVRPELLERVFKTYGPESLDRLWRSMIKQRPPRFDFEPLQQEGKP